MVAAPRTSSLPALRQEGFRAADRFVPMALRGTADSQLADDLHEVVHFSVRGRRADFQVLLHADAGKEVRDHLCEYRRFHRGIWLLASGRQAALQNNGSHCSLVAALEILNHPHVVGRGVLREGQIPAVGGWQAPVPGPTMRPLLAQDARVSLQVDMEKSPAGGSMA